MTEETWKPVLLLAAVTLVSFALMGVGAACYFMFGDNQLANHERPAAPAGPNPKGQ